jgi:hypothetical protein
MSCVQRWLLQRHDGCLQQLKVQEYGGCEGGCSCQQGVRWVPVPLS